MQPLNEAATETRVLVDGQEPARLQDSPTSRSVGSGSIQRLCDGDQVHVGVRLAACPSA